MQQTCTQCGSLTNTSSRFCTNCGTTLAPSQTYQQSWEAPPMQNPAQVPPWAQAQGGMYQQQQIAGPNNQNVGSTSGFGASGNAQAKNLMKIAGFVALGAFLLLLVCVALAIVIPIPGIRTFFLIIAILLILIPWMVFNRIRRMIRRTMGGLERFF